MPRLDIERQKKLEPTRMDYAFNAIMMSGFRITYKDNTRLEFFYKGHVVKFFPYSGWHSGKTIKEGRGIDNLLKQLKK